jgi:hypothetical protein
MRIPVCVCGAVLVVCGFAPAWARAQSTPKIVPKTAEKPSDQRPWSLEVSSQTEQQTGDAADQETDLQISRQVSPKLTVSFGANQQDRYDVVDTQANVGASWAIPDRHMQISGAYTEGFGADETSRHEIEAKVTMALHKRVRPSFEYERKWYVHDIAAHTLTMAAGVQTTKRLGLLGQLLISDSNVGKSGTAGLGGFAYGVNQTLTITGGVGYGHEYFLVKTVSEIRRRAIALAAQVGATIHLKDHRNLELQYQYQDRLDYYKTNVISASYTMSF